MTIILPIGIKCNYVTKENHSEQTLINMLNGFPCFSDHSQKWILSYVLEFDLNTYVVLVSGLIDAFTELYHFVSEHLSDWIQVEEC